MDWEKNKVIKHSMRDICNIKRQSCRTKTGITDKVARTAMKYPKKQYKILKNKEKIKIAKKMKKCQKNACKAVKFVLT